MPLLAGRYQVIAPDLRGLGDSSRPDRGYDKRTVGEDVWRLAHDVLDCERFNLVGHDWGGVVAFSIALDHPQAVRRLAILDVTIPGDGSPGFSQGGRRWHHAFHQTRELPEALIEGREDVYLGWFYRNYGHAPDAIPEEEIDAYVRCYRRPGALSAGFEYYRELPRDIQDNEQRLKNARLSMPVLAVGGASGWGRGSEVFESLSRVASNVRGAVIENCGHWIPEEQPEILARHLLSFLAD